MELSRSKKGVVVPAAYLVVAGEMKTEIVGEGTIDGTVLEWSGCKDPTRWPAGMMKDATTEIGTGGRNVFRGPCHGFTSPAGEARDDGGFAVAASACLPAMRMRAAALRRPDGKSARGQQHVVFCPWFWLDAAARRRKPQTHPVAAADLPVSADTRQRPPVLCDGLHVSVGVFLPR